MAKKPPILDGEAAASAARTINILRRAIAHTAQNARSTPESQEDKKAEKALEEVELRIKADRLEKDHERDEVFRDAVNKAVIWAFRAIIAGITVTGGIWLYHLLTPPSAQWLTVAQLERLRDLLTGGVVSSLLIRYFEKRL